MTLPELDCACANARRASRLITLLYAHEMGNAIEPTQFALLTALSKMPNISQAPLGRALGIDKTSLSRNLRLMEKNGWLKPVKASDREDRRERVYRLTDSGEAILATTKPHWKRAQTKLRTAMTPEEWATMRTVFARVADIAAELLTQSR